MGDDVTASIKRTQESLGKHVKKPPLTDKNLTRPPFRFLHDLVHNVIDQTGFMSGVFTPEELDAANVSSREAKTAFMQKLVQAVKDKTGDDVPVKVSKILAGLEADKTNNLLQSLAKAIEMHQQEGGGGAPPKKGSGGKKPTATAPTGKSKAAASTSKPDAKKGAKPQTDKKDGGSGGTKRTIRDPPPGTKGAAKQTKTQDTPGSGSKGKTKPVKPPAAPEVPVEPSVPESQVNDETGGGEEESPPPPRVQTARRIQRQDSSANMATKPPTGGETEDDVDLDQNANNNLAQTNQTNDLNNGNVDNFDPFSASSSALPAALSPNPAMQTLPPPVTPLLTDADAVTATMTPPTPIKSAHNSLTPTPGPSLTSSPSPMLALGGKGRPPSSGGPPRSLSREQSAASIGEIRPPTGQQQQVRSRPDTGTGGRLSSARPPSARRAPPRPKSSVVREDAEPYRPQTGKVAHVILDNTEEPDDDDNYVVREVTVTAASKPPGLSDLDETPELGGGGILAGMGGDLDVGPDGERGLLVHQILETQKELEDGGAGQKSGEDQKMEKKLKELSLAEIDKLKNLIQVCARSANPLAKLLDYMAEDVDAMHKEYNQFREESKRLSLELEKSKEETEKFLGNLKHELKDLEVKTKDKEDAILASQMKIIQQEERIEEIVVGFERVRSGKGAIKEHMPSAEEILTHIQQGGGGGGSSIGGGGLGGGGGVYGGTGGGFSFSGVTSTPSSAQSGGDGFKIPDAFMANGGGGPGGGVEGTGNSPFSRGRMWQGMGSNNTGGSATFDLGDEDDDAMSSLGGRKNGGRNTGGGFRRSATLMDYNGGNNDSGATKNLMDVDDFNPWGN